MTCCYDEHSPKEPCPLPAILEAEVREPWGDPWCSHPRACSPTGEPKDCGWCAGVAALSDLVEIIDAAGLLNLSAGVQLGATSWYVKASDRLRIAKDVLGIRNESNCPGGECHCHAWTETGQ